MHIVIVGNGVAGMEAALTLRERDPDARITIVSEESDHFFSRTALMWVCAGQLRHRDIEPLERDAYARLSLERVRGRALSVDAERHELRLAGERGVLRYDRLLLACGSRPRTGSWPGSELRGVGHFVTLQDLAWYEQELFGRPGAEQPPRARAHEHVSAPDSPYRQRPAAATQRGLAARELAVIGGGLIGIEAVEVALTLGLQPHFFVREEWFWPMALDAREAAWICERLAAHGVHVHLAHDVLELTGDAHGNVAGVRTRQGEYACDAAVIAIGVVPNTAWLRDSAIALDAAGGILVDAALRASVPDVYAAGDCASVPWSDGTQRPEQLWYTARDQGRIAAASMRGEHARYLRGTPYNSAKLADIEYTTAGAVHTQAPDARAWFYEERSTVRSTTRIVLHGDRVVGFNLLGRRWDHSVLVRFIEERRTLTWVLAHLHEASFDTEFVPPLDLSPARGVHPLPLATHAASHPAAR